MKNKIKKNTSEETLEENNKQKSIGLFDHVKQIRDIQDPDYFDTLSDEDKKTFNHFMILRSMSMNPSFVPTVAGLYQYFDIIPSKQLYRLLISIYFKDKKYYPWIKSNKKQKFSKELLELISRKYEISKKEALDYTSILSNTDEGLKELIRICEGFGLNEKEIQKIMSNE